MATRHYTPDSPAMKAALDAIDRDAARTVIKLTKSAARTFLDVKSRWRLNLLWKGLEVMEPDEALAVLKRAWQLPSYQTFSRRIDIRGARLAFRWTRRHQPENSIQRLDTKPRAPIEPASVYLLMAKHNRLSALACPDDRDTYKARARYWVAMAGVARRAEGSRLPS